jgi:HD superfamily phosphohydrolase YqeK
LRGYFGDDNERIEHAEKVLHYAEELLEHEEGDWHIVIPAAILHDVGIRVAEEKYGSTAGRYQEKEGPPVARQILLQLGFNIGDIEQICVIIAHHHSPGELNSQNFKVLYDADCLVNLQELVGSKSEDELSQVIDEIFFTEIGKELARGTYLSQPEHSHSRR